MSRWICLVAWMWMSMPALAASDGDSFTHLSVDLGGRVWRATSSEVYGPGKLQFLIGDSIIALAAAKESAWVAAAAGPQSIRVHVVGEAQGGVLFSEFHRLTALSDEIALVHGRLLGQQRPFVYLINRAGKFHALLVTRRETQQGPTMEEYLADLTQTQVQFTPAAHGVWLATERLSWEEPALYFVPRVSAVDAADGAAYELMTVKALSPHKEGGACVYDGKTVHFVKPVRGAAKLAVAPLVSPGEQVIAVQAHPQSPDACLVLLPKGIYSLTQAASSKLDESLPGATGFSILEREGELTPLLHTAEGLGFSPKKRPPGLNGGVFGPAGATLVVAEEEDWLWAGSGSPATSFTRFRVPRHWMWSVLPFSLLLWVVATGLGVAAIAIDDWLKARGWVALFMLTGIEAALLLFPESEWLAQFLRVEGSTLTRAARIIMVLAPCTLIVLLAVTRKGHDFLRAVSGEKIYALLLLLLLRIPWVFRRMFSSGSPSASSKPLPQELAQVVQSSAERFVKVPPVASGAVGETARALHAAMLASFNRDGRSFPIVVGVETPPPANADEFALAFNKALGPLALDAARVLKPLLRQRRIRVILAASDASDGVSALSEFANAAEDTLAGCVIRGT